MRSSIDPCLYTYVEHVGADSHILWICVYVDDALIICNHPPLRARFVKDLSQRFPIEDKGELTWILNVSIERDRANRTLVMSQASYITDLLTKFGDFIDSSLTHHFDCPMDEGLILSSDDQPRLGSSEFEAMGAKREARGDPEATLSRLNNFWPRNPPYVDGLSS